jgi:hypothetical protein
MSATCSMFEAVLGDTTELSEAHELVHSSGNCGTLEPRWWVVDIGVRARTLDTSAGSISRPGPSEFREPHFGSRAPLHLRIDAGLLDGRTGSNRSWLIDATSTRAYLFASSIVIHLVGPASLTPYDAAGGRSQSALRDVFVQVQAGIWACDTHYQQGIPGVPARGNNCSIRVRVPAGRTDVAMPIPAGARTLAIFDASGGNSPWTWQLGENAGDRSGRIVVLDGQTVDTALVPNFSHVAPATPSLVDSDVLLVFGVDL